MTKPAILLTCNESQAKRLALRLSQLAVDSLSQPVVEIRRVSPTNMETLRGHQPDVVIALSANAVRHLPTELKPLVQNAPLLIAIGKRTQLCLHEQLQVDSHRPEHPSSEGILAMPTVKSLTKQNILILKGLDGRDHLSKQLASQGTQPVECTCYQRVIPNILPSELQKQCYDKKIKLFFINSNSGLDNLIKLLDEPDAAYWEDKTLVVVSERCKKYAEQKLPSAAVYAAQSVADEDIIQTIENLT